MNNRLQKIFSVYNQAEKHLARESVSVKKDILHKAFASIYSPGPSFQYIFDFNTRSFDFVSSGVKSMLGFDPETFTPGDFVNTFHPDDVTHFQHCEEITRYFLFEHISLYQIPFYKVSYQFRMGNAEQGYKLFLHQSITLSTDSAGKISRVLVNHSDISHITSFNNGTISFINITDGKSYTGIKSISDLKSDNRKNEISLTSRELEILHLISEGFSSKEISTQLYISFDTVRTHRKNILSKTGLKNMTQVVSYCIKKGLI